LVPISPLPYPQGPAAVLDLFTSFRRAMPVAAAPPPMGAIPGQTAMLAAGPKASRPANFTFCPNPAPTAALGATALSCATAVPSPIGSGTQPGRVRYKAGPNQFGGVMNTLVGGAGYRHVVPPGVLDARDRRPGHTYATIWLAAKRPIVEKSIGPWGGPRQQRKITDLDPAPLYAIAGTVSGGIVTDEFGFMDLNPGPGSNWAATPMNTWGFTNLGQLRQNFGFPFTTGTVTVSFDPASVSGPPDIMIVRGSDMRTQLGKGTLTLVSGGLSNSIVQPNSDQNSAQGSHILMILPEPRSLVGAATGLAALAGAQVAVRRQRLRR
jgi:hypothetical protein